MRYSQLADIYEQLEETRKKLQKRDILAEFYKSCPTEQLSKVVLLSMGIVVTGEQELGIANEMMRRIVSRTYGFSETDVVKKFKETGDLGLTAEYFSSHRKQKTLAKKELTVDHVFENLEKLPGIIGTGSQDKKVSLVAELLSNASGKEARYIVRTVLGDMRIGVAHGIVRDAIAKAFGKDAKDIEHLYNVLNDFGRVAEYAKKGKMKAEIAPGLPVRVMLADRASDLKTALEEFDEPASEWKYDGFRMQIHKDGNNVKIFSRRLDDVTNQFPDVVALTKECIRTGDCIIEGETLAVGKDGKPKPFQQLSRRIQRKYDIEKMVKEIPVQVNLFDMLYLNGKSYMTKPFRDRWNELKKVIKETKNFRLADHIETKDFNKANAFYKAALAAGQEGVIVKNLDAHYQPGKRVGYWLKVKQILEPLDLVVVGAIWGEGKRAKWLGSLILACRKGDKFLPTGKMGSGLTEEHMKELTKKLKELIIEEHGNTVTLKPKIVIEVGYEEIQKSPKYPTGYALRFPRLLRIRTDEKRPEDANTCVDIERLFKQQKRVK